MSGGFILIAGPKHSRRNAQAIEEWRKTVPDVTHSAFVGMVRGWEKRGYLNAEDAKALIEDGA